TGFSPQKATTSQGQTVGWSLLGNGSHQLVDASGMDLFDSGVRVSGSSFQFTLNSAGNYPVSDSVTGASSTIAIPVQVPAKGKVNTPFTVTWSAAPPVNGFVFDSQIQIPGGTFQDWMIGQTASSASYTPATAGNYLFKARLRQVANGASSNWSPAATVNVLAH